DQAIADCELGVELEAFQQIPAALEFADLQAAENVDDDDDNAGDGIAADEFGCAVHCAIKVGFLRNFLAAAAGFGLVDGAGVDIGIDGHLLAGHGVEGESRGDFGDAGCAFGDYYELNHHDDGEDDDADGQGVAGDEI